MYHVCFYLLPAKTRQCYVEMLGHLRNVCATYELTLNISCLRLDFEIAVQEAAHQLLPDVIMKACQFDLAQAWWRKIQGLGMTNVYKDSDAGIGKCLKLLFGMWFLKPETVEECFVFDIFPDAHENENAIMIADYVKHTSMDHLHLHQRYVQILILTVNVPRIVVKVSTEGLVISLSSSSI